jgi:hypothetical protein
VGDARPEGRLLVGIVRLSALLVAASAVVGGLVGGRAQALSALAGAALVAVLAITSAAALAFASTRGPRAVLLALGGGVVVRLVVYALALSGLAGLPWVSWTSLAGATVVTLALTLGYEIAHLARRPRLFWVEIDEDPARTARTDVGVTRSEAL